MTKLRALFLLAALALPLAVIAVGVGQRLEDPAQLLYAVRRRLAAETPNQARALAELERGLRLARERGPRELERSLRLELARLYYASGDSELCTRTCLALLAEFDPRDAEALELAAEARLRAEDGPAARELADRLVEVLPGQPAGQRLAGEARIETARAHLAQLEERLARLHPRATAFELAELARANAPRPATSLSRKRFEERLRLAFPEHERAAGTALFTQAAGELAAARDSFAACIALAPDGRALFGLQSLLIAAGRASDAADLGRFALERAVLAPTEVAIGTGNALLAAGQVAALQELLGQRLALVDMAPFQASSLSFAERLAWCRTLYGAQSWGLLAGTAWVLTQSAFARAARAGTPPAALPFFLQAAAELRLGKPRELVASIYQSVRAAGHLELGDLAGDARLLEAELAKLGGRTLEERAAYQRALQSLPEPADAAARARLGRIWQRLGEIALETGQPEEADCALARAMVFLPQERAALEALWRKAGEAAEERARWPLDRPALTTLGPYAACQWARGQLGRNRTRAVELCLTPVLAEVPGFPPALELLARCALARGEHARAIDAVLELGQRGFAIDALLDEIPRANLRGPALARLVAQFQPSVRIELAASFLATGQTQRGLALLEPVTYPARPAGEVGLAAAELARQGRIQPALERIESLPGSAPGRAAALIALLAGALERQDAQLLSRGVELARGTIPVFDEPGFLSILDVMIANGELRDTWTLLVEAEKSLLGSTSPHEVPAREILLREALVLVMDRSAEADELLERWAPLARADELSVGRLLHAMDVGAMETLPERAASLLADRIPDEPLVSALLFALRGDLGAAEAALHALEAAPGARAPLVPLARAWITGAGPEELGPWSALAPERGLSWLLSLATRPWAFWTLARLRELPAELRSSPWFALLQAQALAQVGRADEAARALEACTAEAPDAPGAHLAWLEREALAAAALEAAPPRERLRAFDSLQALRAARIARFGPGGASPAQVALAEAVRAELAGESERARDVLDEALGRAPDDRLLVEARARVALELGDPGRAAELRLALLATASPAEARRLAPDVLTALGEEHRAGRLAPRALRLELEALTASHPDEPLFARALAEDLGRGTLASLEPLETFFDANPGTSIEELRPGEARHWCLLLQALDPERAASFARAELDHAPLDLDLWHALVLALETSGRRAAALELARGLLTLVPDARIAASATRIEAELAAPAARGPIAIDAGLLATDGELALRVLLHRLEGNAGDRPAALAEANALWAQRRLAGIALEPFAHRYATALAAVDPARAAQVLKEAREAAVDELDRALLGAYETLLAAGPSGASSSP